MYRIPTIIPFTVTHKMTSQNTKATVVFEVLTAVLAENQVLQDMTLGKAHSCRCFKGRQWLHIQSQIVFIDHLTLKMTLWTFEMPAPLHANSSITSQKPLLLYKSPFHTDNRLTADSWLLLCIQTPPPLHRPLHNCLMTFVKDNILVTTGKYLEAL